MKEARQGEKASYDEFPLLFNRKIYHWSQSRAWRIAIAVSSSLLAVALSHFFLPYGDFVPYLFSTCSVFLVALICGFQPGLLAMLLVTVGSALYVYHPYWSFEVTSVAERQWLLFFFSVGFLYIWVGSKFRRDQIALWKTQSVLRSVIEATADGILVVNRVGGMAFFNAKCAQMWEIPTDILTSREDRKAIDYVAPQLKDPHGFVTKIKELYSQPDAVSTDTLEFKDGRFFERFSQPQMLGNEVVGRVWSFRDITKIEEAKRVLREAIQMRDDFLLVASHELRTPLTSLKMQVQLLRRMLPLQAGGEDSSVNRLIKLIGESEGQLDQFTRLVDDLLNASRMSSGRVNLSFNLEWMDLSEVVRSVLNRYQLKVSLASCPVSFDGNLAVYGRWDALRMEEVIVSLLENAVKYAPGAPIDVSIQQVGETARLVVKDHGHGIAVEDHQRIFECFERTGNAKNCRGFGLGLFIARQITEGHGGKIWVESKPGHGAAFVVELPIGKAETSATATSALRA